MTVAKSAGEPKKKSGIKSFAPGEVLFNENDIAESLYIIQKGQIRLYRPKGRGFVELAILRTGEVIGEMAYFDEKSRKRSCSAAAIVTTEVIEVSFNAFAKTMQGLNPWFKTIINTLADRLRKTNEKVKALESNSVGFGQGGKVAEYKFYGNTDVIRMLSVIYLTFKAHSETVEKGHQLHLNKIKFYASDVFNVQEIKFEEFMQLLKEHDFLEFVMDEDGFPKIIRMVNFEQLRAIMLFFNAQRMADDSKRLVISPKCEMFLKRIIDQLTERRITTPKAVADISPILADFEERRVPITDEDLADAVNAGLCDDIIVGEANKLTCDVNFDKLKQMFPSIKLMNAVAKANEVKNKANNRYS